MRSFAALLICMWSLAACPALAQVTMPLERMDSMQIDAVARATALIEDMPAGVARQQSAVFIAYRLMMRGDCPNALPVLNRELTRVADPTALGGLVTGALTGRDARCMAWVAARVDAALRGGTLDQAQRAELRLRGHTLFALVGQTTRAATMPPADQTALEIVPEALRHRQIMAGNTVVDISFSDMPTRLETLLLDRLWAYRRTPLQLSFARALAARADSDPDFLSRAGWVEVALVLFGAGEREAAQRVLVAGRVRYMTLAGLEAELAYRGGDLERVVSLLAANDWGTKGNTLYRIFERQPALLVPYIEGDAIFSARPSEGVDLFSLVSWLDRAGQRESAELAARTALRRIGPDRHADARRAETVARIGDFQGARGLLHAAHVREEEGLWRFRVGIARSAALIGNRKELELVMADAPEGERNAILFGALAAIARTDSPLKELLQDRVEARLAATGGFGASADTIAEFARAGLRDHLLVALVQRLPRGREGAAAAIRIANAARQNGHRELAIAIAEAADALLPEGPQADAELVTLAEFYWRLRLPEKAVAMASRISHPVGRVDAMTRALVPRQVEARPQLSFVSFSAG